MSVVESPKTRRSISPSFFISRYETTIAQFSVYADEIGLDIRQMNLLGSPDLAAYNVTWSDAVGTQAGSTQNYDLLSHPRELKPCLREGSVTLPSEAEWEKLHAARTEESFRGVLSSPLISPILTLPKSTPLDQSLVMNVLMVSRTWLAMCGIHSKSPARLSL